MSCSLTSAWAAGLSLWTSMASRPWLAGRLSCARGAGSRVRNRDADPERGRLGLHRTHRHADARLNLNHDLLAATQNREGCGLVAGCLQSFFQVIGFRERGLSQFEQDVVLLNAGLRGRCVGRQSVTISP